MLGVAETLLKKIKGKSEGKKEKTKTRPQVIPYLHKVSHNLKKVAERFDVPLVFSAPCKLAQLCPRIQEKKNDARLCTVNHANRFVDCNVGVVYRIPLTCGRVYIGQTGRCVNERMREHDLALRSTPGGHLPLHCRDCLCQPIFQNTTIVGKAREKAAREVLEAHAIKKEGTEGCVSQPSIFLHQKESDFIDAW